jgi:hypothetical protein
VYAAHSLAADGLRLKAIVCESRPLNEGVSLAAEWAAAGVDCTVITDAQAAAFVDQADLCLVGADAITEQSVVNKVPARCPEQHLGYRCRCQQLPKVDLDALPPNTPIPTSTTPPHPLGRSAHTCWHSQLKPRACLCMRWRIRASTLQGHCTCWHTLEGSWKVVRSTRRSKRMK